MKGGGWVLGDGFALLGGPGLKQMANAQVSQVVSTRRLRGLSKRRLFLDFSALVGREHRDSARVIAYVAEIDRRKLYLEHAYPSMFAFCTEGFRMSESMASKRIRTARAACRFPRVLRMIGRGELHMTGAYQLAPHLSDDNHRELLRRAKHRTMREIDRLIAEFHPKPDAKSSVRALPTRPSSGLGARARVRGRGAEADSPSARHGNAAGLRPDDRAAGGAGAAEGAGVAEGASAAGRAGATKGTGAALLHAQSTVQPENLAATTDSSDAGAASSLTGAVLAGANGTSADRGLAEGTAASASGDRDASGGAATRHTPIGRSRRPSGRSTPLSPGRYRLTVTIGEKSRATLDELRGLLSHQIPDGDLAAIVERALEVLLEETKKKKAALVKNPRGDAGRRPSGRPKRGIPANIRRKVYERDGGKCAFRDATGRRCGSKWKVEFHHKVPYAKGGRHTIANIELRCRAHNQWEAELDFGKDVVAKRRERPR